MLVCRREFLAAGVALTGGALKPILIHVNAMMDQGAHSAKGLNNGERARFWACQARAVREFGVSGIHFDLRVQEGAYLRQQGHSIIPDKFLMRKTINLFVTARWATT